MNDIGDLFINEEYKIWKKNTPFLYDLVLTHALEWPSLTVQWLSETFTTTENFREHFLILGTHTSEGEPNYLLVVKARLNSPDSEIDVSRYDDETEEIGGFGGSKIEIIQKIPHNGEVNRARCLPSSSNVIATQTITGDVNIFNRELQKSNTGTFCKPDIICKGHSQEGYGLSWNVSDNGHLIGGSNDGLVCYWDINGAGAALLPLSVFHVNSNSTFAVEDCSWSPFYIDTFASVGGDKTITLWDRRQAIPLNTVEDAHSGVINSISFSDGCEYLFATGSADKNVHLWDIRNVNTPVHVLKSHTDEVFTVQWAPKSKSVLASASADRRVNIWDISLTGKDQTIEDAADGPPELLFIHGGHTNKVSDFSWFGSDTWLCASVAEDNILQIWEMGDNIYSTSVYQNEINDLEIG